MRIGILTGGGDVPGLNPCIKSVVHRAHSEGSQVIGIKRGWAGLLNYNTDAADKSEWVEPITLDSVRRINRYGGTYLHTSRTNPSKVNEGAMPIHLRDQYPTEDGPVDTTAHILKTIEALQLDAIIPIGGDDTLSYGARLHQEGVPVVSIPKTMDNDVFGTDYCIGFSTAITRTVEAIDQLRTPTGSHERIAVVEVFGRNCGETALVSAYLSHADRALISEVPFDINHLAELVMTDRQANPSNYAIIIVSEGANMEGQKILERGRADAYGHRKLGGIGIATAEALSEITGVNTLQQQLGYLMRAGSPDSLDQMVATNYGALAVDILISGGSGQMVSLQEGKYTTVAADAPVQGLKRVDTDQFYDSQNYMPRVKDLRDKPMFLY